MTNEQFRLCTSGTGHQTEAARKVLVFGLPVRQVAEHHGLAEQSVRNKITQVRNRYRAILAAFCNT